MNKQEVKHIKLSDLVLWTENPRDPIDGNANNQAIVDLASEDKSHFWKLQTLAKEMGEYYDYSELPTVVVERGKHIVYDGNRRVILALIAKKLVRSDLKFSSLPEVDDEIPCNVCSREVAINNVLRKHSSTGSWRPLFRDQFVSKNLGTPKSTFEIIEEATGFISANEKMNQGFVRDEIFTTTNLDKLGLRVNEGKLESRHSNDDMREIFEDLLEKIECGALSTRNSRGDVYGVLGERTKQLIENSKENKYVVVSQPKNVETSEEEESTTTPKQRTTRRTKPVDPVIFGDKLILKSGEVNDLYRDVCDLYDFFLLRKGYLSVSFTALIRMSLRLLCETASKDKGYTDFKDYIKKFFPEAKKNMTQDVKTTLSAQNVTADSMTQLLQTGAHNYTSSKNFEQTIAISYALGAMLRISHRRA